MLQQIRHVSNVTVGLHTASTRNLLRIITFIANACKSAKSLFDSN